MGPILAQIIKFASVGFKGASELEGALDQAITQLAQQAEEAANAPPEPSPEQVKAEAAKAESDARINEITQKGQLKQQESAAELEFMKQKFMLELNHKTQMFALEMQQKREMAAMEAQTARDKSMMEAEQNNARFVQERMQDANESAQRLGNQQVEADVAAAQAAAKPPAGGTGNAVQK
jgi:hypothetical protein